ncbi:MAG: DUF4173 domain-containing protein [Candidatus Saccharibacteria bacterium]|nr:DUF4173 domain-containing protein [Candidatus Saccharibacteria bacterium]
MSKTGVSAPLARLILELSFILAATVVYVFSWNRLGIQLPLTTVALSATIVVLTGLSKRPLYRRTVIFMGLAITISLFSAFRLDNMINALNLWSVMFLMAFAGLNQVMPGKLWLKEYFLRSWTLPFKGAQQFGGVLAGSKLTLNRHLSRSQQGILRGLLLSIPVLLVFGLLFASADAVFKDLFSELTSLNTLWRTVISPRIILTALFTMALSGMLLYVVSGADKPSEKRTVKKAYNTELTVMLGMVNVLFFTFVIIQAVYLFGGHDVVLNSDISYAEYGRKGFFELVWVAIGVFGLGFVFKGWNLLKAHKLNLVLLYVLIAQVGIIILSALKRLSLYEQTYGFSELRVYAHMFVFFIIIAFVLLVLAIERKWLDTTFLHRLVLLGVGYVLLVNVVNVPALVARQNLANPPQNGQVDYNYIMSLSPDALPSQIEVLERVKDQANVGYYRNYLCNNQGRRSIDQNRHWSEYSFSQSSALSMYRDAGCQPLS